MEEAGDRRARQEDADEQPEDAEAHDGDAAAPRAVERHALAQAVADGTGDDVADEGSAHQGEDDADVLDDQPRDERDDRPLNVFTDPAPLAALLFARSRLESDSPVARGASHARLKPLSLPDHCRRP